MKQLLVSFFILFLLTSCGGSKKVVDNTSNKIEKAQNSKKIKEEENLISKKDTTTVETSDNPEITINTNTLEEKEEKQTTSEEFLETFNHNSFDELLQTYVSNEGNVNYKGIKDERSKLTTYITSLGKHMPNNSWTKEDKLAYWINAYNAMTIDLIIRHYPVSSIKDIKDPWKQRYWQIGEKWYNLDEIEHQIIRKMGEPRIHFALVCAAVSCPKLYNKAFTAATLEEDLSKLTREFLTDTSKNLISENSIELSKIFSWFAKDFKQNGSLIDFLNIYTDIKILDTAKKRFKSYNWDLND